MLGNDLTIHNNVNLQQFISFNSEFKHCSKENSEQIQKKTKEIKQLLDLEVMKINLERRNFKKVNKEFDYMFYNQRKKKEKKRRENRK